jgi:16S rRNA processing protein RimM
MAKPGPRAGDLVLIGRVVKPQGRHGEVLVHPLSDRPDRFPALEKAFVTGPGDEAREVRVTSSWPHRGRHVLKLEGVDSIDEAERLRDRELRIAEEELAPLPEGSFYHHQLMGLRVADGAGDDVGVVEDVMETGAGAPILVIRGAEGETLVPLAVDFVKTVDLAGARIVIERPEYAGAD